MHTEEREPARRNSALAKPDIILFSHTHGDPLAIDLGDDEFTVTREVGVEDAPACGALSCFDERSSAELWMADQQLSKEDRKKKLARIFAETSGRGHGSVEDQARFIFVLENVPRTFTLHAVQPPFGEYLQQSLRRANASRGVCLPSEVLDSIHGESVLDTMQQAFDLYEEMAKAGIPLEDARIILPLATRTNIQISMDPRELKHLHHMSRFPHIPSVTRNAVNEMIALTQAKAPNLMAERPNSYEPRAWYPAPQLFSMGNQLLDALVDEHRGELLCQNAVCLNAAEVTMSRESQEWLIEGVKDKDPDLAALSVLSAFHYTYLARMSLMTLHQALRQRTWDQSTESIYRAVARGQIIIPPSFTRNPALAAKFMDLSEKMFGLYFKLVEAGVAQQEAINVIPHCLVVYDMIHINGWNAMHSVGKRTCTEAQWEIRDVAQAIAADLHSRNPMFRHLAQPQGVVYGKCPEKRPCGKCESIRRKLGEE